MTFTELPTCEGCGRRLGPIEALQWSVCMDCTKARARAAQTNGRCKCGSKRRPGDELSTGGVTINGTRRGGRSWIPCRRCLGTIRQTS